METGDREEADKKQMRSTESREARKRRRSKRGRKTSAKAHETLSSLSNSISKEHFSHMEGNVGRYDSLITAKRLKL